MLNPEHSPQQVFWNISQEVIQLLAAAAKGQWTRTSRAQKELHHQSDTHTSGTRREDAGLICAIHDPEKVLAGSEDLRDEH